MQEEFVGLRARNERTDTGLPKWHRESISIVAFGVKYAPSFAHPINENAATMECQQEITNKNDRKPRNKLHTEDTGLCLVAAIPNKLLT